MKAKKVASYGILVALAIALSYLETLIPWTVAAPGVKLGLANTVTILALYRLSFRDACAISLLRVLLVGILFGNAFSLAFSAAGAIVSLAVMLPLSRAHPDNTILVCMAGGVAHNAGQILAAGLLTHAWQIAWYFLVLCLTGILAANTGKPLDVVRADCERDNFMTAQEAMEYGLIDKVIDHR